MVRETLRSLELADRPSLLVFNRSDMLRGEEGDALREALGAEFPAAIFTSATTGDGLDALRTRLAETSAARFKRVRVIVAYSDGALVQRVRERGQLRAADYSERGIEIDADVPPDLAKELTSKRLAPLRPREA